MKLLKNLLDTAGKIIQGNPLLKHFYPVFEAADELILGTDKTTKGDPHIADGLDLKRYMSLVIVALVPAAAAGVYFFGLRVVALIAISYIFGGLTEVAFSVFRKKPLYEGFLVTGLIYPLILPPDTPLWVAAVGIIFGVFFAKEVFGGTGRNIFNPALVGRLFITLAFPGIMSTSWRDPVNILMSRGAEAVDAVTKATPLIAYKTNAVVASYPALLLGGEGGSIGEIFRLGIILGGLFLIFTKVSNWRIPLSYLGSVLLLSFLGNIFLPGTVAPPLFQLLSGGLLFGAMFMATDPVTSPLTVKGKYIFGIGCGLLTVLIRTFSGNVEGVMYSIVFMNAFAPLIDVFALRLKYGPREA